MCSFYFIFLFGRGMNDGGGMCKREQAVACKQGM